MMTEWSTDMHRMGTEASSGEMTTLAADAQMDLGRLDHYRACSEQSPDGQIRDSLLEAIADRAAADRSLSDGDLESAAHETDASTRAINTASDRIGVVDAEVPRP